MDSLHFHICFLAYFCHQFICAQPSTVLGYWQTPIFYPPWNNPDPTEKIPDLSLQNTSRPKEGRFIKPHIETEVQPKTAGKHNMEIGMLELLSHIKSCKKSGAQRRVFTCSKDK